MIDAHPRASASAVALSRKAATLSVIALVYLMSPDARPSSSVKGSGLFRRMMRTISVCYVWPDPPPIGPITLEYDDETRDRRERLTGAARLLWGLKMGADYSGDPAPHALRLDGTTLALFDEMRQDAMRLARASRGLAAGWHGKTPGRALRLALVFELLAWAAGNGTEPLTVSGDAMIRAGGYLDYLLGMFDRVTGGLAIGPAEADAAVIARHILSTLPATLNERALYQQAGWSWLRPNERRAATFRVLADAGWIRPAAHTGVGRRSGGWNISPRLRRSSP